MKDELLEQAMGAAGVELNQEELNALFSIAWDKGDYARARGWAERGADPKSCLSGDASGKAHLCDAIGREDWETARMISFRYKEREALDGRTPLMMCAISGEPEAIEIARELIGRGARLDLTDDDWVTALGLCASFGMAVMARELIEAGASLSEPGRPGAKPLAMAFERGDPAMIWALLEGGANPDDAKGGESPREALERMPQGRWRELSEQALLSFEERSELPRGGGGAVNAGVAAGFGRPKAL